MRKNLKHLLEQDFEFSKYKYDLIAGKEVLFFSVTKENLFTGRGGREYGWSTPLIFLQS